MNYGKGGKICFRIVSFEETRPNFLLKDPPPKSEQNPNSSSLVYVISIDINRH